MKQSHAQKEVGPWARHKLDILREYLEFYITALKRQNFNLVYIDAFAGSGILKIRGTNATDINQYIRGSPYCALELPESHSFNHHYFFEKDPKRVSDLSNLKKQFLDKNIYVKEGEANTLIQDLLQKSNFFRRENTRGVAFLDPYGAHLEWATVKALAETKKMEVIINFPVSMAINRLILKSGEMPEDWKKQLNQYFGTEEWHDIAYKETVDLFGHEVLQKQDNIPDQLLKLYIDRLRSIYTCVAVPYLIRNTRNTPLYHLIWAGPNELGLRGANYILSKQRTML